MTEGKNENSIEDEAHGLGPNPRAQLFGTKSVKSHLNTLCIKNIILLHLEGFKQQNPNRMENEWHGMEWKASNGPESTGIYPNWLFIKFIYPQGKLPTAPKK